VSLPTVRSVYLTGPTNGLPELNVPAFERAAEELRSYGLRVIALHELPEGDYLAALGSSDAVVTLPDWENAPSCGIEVAYAEALGKPVWHISEFRLTREGPLVA